jgi:uncharacterized membrane protein HdeD (DUF308 family)
MDSNPAELKKIARNWKFVRTLGIVLLVGGLIGMLAPQFLTVAIIKMLGFLLLLGGVAQTASALQLRGKRVIAPIVISGLLMAGCGLLFLVQTTATAKAFTLILGAFFLVQGFFKVSGAFYVKPDPVWGWIAIEGVITVVLGALVLSVWREPTSSILGLLVGINLFFSGITALAVASNLRRLDETAS